MLILITGGAWQGKSAFARTLAGEYGRNVYGESAEECAGERKERPGEASGAGCGEGFTIFEDIHLLVKAALEEGRDALSEITGQIDRHPNVILTVNELGCGVVPVEAFDRNWRETTGRVCCALARRADAVYRVTCGIATRIK